MKKVAYLEVLSGRVQFSLQKGFLQLLSKKAWIIGKIVCLEDGALATMTE